MLIILHLEGIKFIQIDCQPAVFQQPAGLAIEGEPNPVQFLGQGDIAGIVSGQSHRHELVGPAENIVRHRITQDSRPQHPIDFIRLDGMSIRDNPVQGIQHLIGEEFGNGNRSGLSMNAVRTASAWG